MKTSWLIATLFLVILGACSSARVSEGTAPSTESACLAAGGSWGWDGIPCDDCKNYCEIKLTDAGKICRDSSECRGICLAVEESSTSGECSASKGVVSCYYYLEDGHAYYRCTDASNNSFKPKPLRGSA